MATEAMTPTYFEPAAATHPELLGSAALHLMLRYSANTDDKDCTKRAAVIERNLQVLAELPGLAPVLRATCRQLWAQWALVALRATPSREKQNQFLRFVAGGNSFIQPENSKGFS